MTALRLTVLLGGTSSERDVSLSSGIRMADALRSRGHHVTVVDTAYGALSEADQAALLSGTVMRRVPPDTHALKVLERGLPTRLQELPPSDVVVLGLHGGVGEDGTIQALLDLLGVPYTGSGHLASALAMDKDLSKHLFSRAGVPTARWQMAPVTADAVVRDPGFPCIVKPSKQGSTVGLTLVRDPNDLQPAIDLALQFDDEVMVEQFIAGRELTVPVLGDAALPVGEIIPKKELYDYECKYTAGMAVEIFPADLTAEQTRRVQDLAVRAYVALKLSGCARIDFRLGADDEFYCLEANTLPGMTQLSLVPQSAAAARISFPELCERIVLQALMKRGVTNG